MSDPRDHRQPGWALSVLRVLERFPKWLVFLAIGALCFGGLAVDGPLGALCLGVIAVVVAALAVLQWPYRTSAQRALPAGAAIVLAACAVAKLVWT